LNNNPETNASSDLNTEAQNIDCAVRYYVRQLSSKLQQLVFRACFYRPY